MDLLFLEALRWTNISNSHARLTLLWVLFAFCILPNGDEENPSKKYRLHYISTCWFATALFLLSYATSGFWKLYSEISHIFDSSTVSVFHPEALPTLLASYSVRTGQEIPWADFLISHSWLSAFMFVPIVLAQATAYLPLFWPRLSRIYGLIFFSFHLFSLFIPTIPFTTHIFLCGLFLILSPFFTDSKIALLPILDKKEK